MHSVPASFRFVSGLFALVLACGSVVQAQDSTQARPSSTRPPTASVTGTVTSAQDSEPLMGVQVLVKGTRHWALTNQTGSFRLDGLTPGAVTIEFRPQHRGPLAYPLTLAPGKTINLAVKVDTRHAVALPEVVVEGADKPAAKMGEFLRHKNAGHGGYFITRTEIEKKQPRVMSDMLRRVPGLRVDCGFGTCQVQTFEEARRIMGGCPIQYFLDGAPFGGDIDELTPDQIEGIEIYRGSSTIPPEFNTGTSMCGVIAVWSRVPGR
jgi:hypothetical protein